MYQYDSNGILIWVEDSLDQVQDTSLREPDCCPTPILTPSLLGPVVDRFGAMFGVELWATYVDGPGGLDLCESVVHPETVAYAYLTEAPDRAYHSGPLEEQVLVVSSVEGVRGLSTQGGWALILVGDLPRQIPTGAARTAVVGPYPMTGAAHYKATSFAEQTAALRSAMLDLLEEGEFTPNGSSSDPDRGRPAPDPKGDPIPAPQEADVYAFLYGSYTDKAVSKQSPTTMQVPADGVTANVHTHYGIKVTDGRKTYKDKWASGSASARSQAVSKARSMGWLEYGYTGPAARGYDVYASADALAKESATGYLLVDRNIDARVAAYLRKEGFANRCILKEDDAVKYPDLAWGYTAESDRPPVALAGKVGFGRKAKGYPVGQFFDSAETS